MSQDKPPVSISLSEKEQERVRKELDEKWNRMSKGEQKAHLEATNKLFRELGRQKAKDRLETGLGCSIMLFIMFLTICILICTIYVATLMVKQW